ncbi:SulP family inorganic anion transporter [Mangrovactinospora gilvigrisea]|uniref:SulP family inorganic anion transporter n=1 Tax=Mangrovactinospora gilvigrisea TaxID=1428644 RepID=UPI001FEC6C02|nr:SulP family inorganic anion transporter [Mangrovactinospora gilvigrisea]
MAARLRKVGRPTGADVASGLVTGLFSIPEGMAYAAIGGFSPIAGLYAGVVPAVVGSLLARTVLMVTTLTSAIALTSQSVLADAHLDPHAAGNIALLAVLAGVVMLLMGVLRLGAVMSFVSNAVMTGFSTGIALQIITGVLKDATGYAPHGHNRLVQLGDWLVHLPHWDGTATALAAGTVAAWAAAHAVKALRATALLLAMVAASLVSGLAGLDVETVRDIARIPAALPHFTAPDLGATPHLIGGAVSVALVALAQAAGIGPTVPNPDGSRSSVNGDFLAQGAANAVGGLFQALPVGGSLSRTGVAVAAGARTRWAGVFSGVWLALIVLAVGSLAERIPMPVIGGLILVVGGELIWGKRADIALVLRTSPLSAAAMVLTFLATTQLPLQRAIILGAVLSLLLYCAQAARRARLVALTPQDGHWRVAEPPAEFPSGAVTVLYYDGVSLFAEVPRIDAAWPRTAAGSRAAVVLVVRGMPDVPSSAVVKVLRRYARTLRDGGGRLTLAGVEPRLARILAATGATADVALVPAEPTLFAPLEKAVADAEAWLAEPPGR